MEKILSPLDFYKESLLPAFTKNAEEMFDGLVNVSGIDTQSNAKTTKLFRERKAAFNIAKKKAENWGRGKAFAWIFIILSGIAAIFFFWKFMSDGENSMLVTAIILALVVGILVQMLFAWINPNFVAAKTLRDKFESESNKLLAEAWAQMGKLNKLFDWDIPILITNKTFPNLKFDPYFTEHRLRELKKYGFPENVFRDEKSSVLFTQSGEHLGNPFMFYETKNMYWSEKIYTGERTVPYEATETYTDKGGKQHSRIVIRYQTLTASISRDYPEYSYENEFVYCHNAAPNLCFSRRPNGLAENGDSFLGFGGIKGKIKSLEKHSRNLTDKFPYTMMSNKEFEALFETRDRDNETEMRILFTPNAQIEMLKLLRDRTSAFGDSFSFIKRRKLNWISYRNMNSVLEFSPEQFRDFDFSRMRETFIEKNCDYFRKIYFTFAPIFTSTALQEPSNTTQTPELTSAFLEHEAIANYHGEKYFAHPKSERENILKIDNFVDEGDGKAVFRVTAHGFYSIPRVHKEICYANDGEPWEVDVHWREYFPITNSRHVRIFEDRGNIKQRDKNPLSAYAKTSTGGNARRMIFSNLE